MIKSSISKIPLATNSRYEKIIDQKQELVEEITEKKAQQIMLKRLIDIKTDFMSSLIHNDNCKYTHKEILKNNREFILNKSNRTQS